MIGDIYINFFLKKNKALVSGLTPVYLRISLSGYRVEISTRRHILPDQWNQVTQKMRGKSTEANAFNQYMKVMEQQIFNVHAQLMNEGRSFTVDDLRDRLEGKTKQVKIRTLIPIFREHNERIKQLVGKEYSAGTCERYNTCLSHTVEFMQWQYQKNDLDIKEIDHHFISSYDYYLRSKRGCSNNTTVKYLKNFKKIIRICLANGWIQTDPFLNYKVQVKEVVRDYLSMEEIQRLMDKVFSLERLSLVRDIFLFSCYTGLAYVDVQKLTNAEIMLGIDGKKWIFTSRQKTDVPSRIPLLAEAIRIIEKYKDDPRSINQDKVFPILSNQKMNSYLKEIATLCGINKELTFHIARHTFATTVTLSNGVPIESVSKMLGHKNIRTTQHYAKILDSKVSEDMEVLRKKLES